MNPKNTVVLALTAIVLFAFIYLFERHWTEAGPGPTKVLSGFSAEATTCIEVRLAKQLPIRAVRTNGTWRLMEPVVYQAQADAVERLLRALEQLSFLTQISADELRNQANPGAAYGLDEPQATLLIEQGGDTRQLKLGSLTAPRDALYAQVVGDASINVVNAEVLRMLPQRANDWRDTAFLNLHGTAFDRLTVSDGSKPFEMQREVTNKLWRMKTPMPARVDNPKMDELLYQLENLRVAKFGPDNAGSELERYGLQPPELEMTFSQGTNQLATYQFGKTATNEDGLIYARQAGQNAVVLVPAEAVKPWKANWVEFRDRRLAGLTSGVLDAIDFAAGADKVSVVKTNGAWFIMKPWLFPADGPGMHEFITALGNLEVVPYNGQFAVKDVVIPTDLPKYGLASPERKYILQRLVAAGAQTNLAVAAELDFGSADGLIVYARRGDAADEASVYAVRKMDLERLPTRALDLCLRKVWNFPVDRVSKVFVRNNGAVMEFVHLGQQDWGVGSAGGLIKNKMALETGVNELGELEVGSWVENAATDTAKYGITDKSTRISVDLSYGTNTMALHLDIGGAAPNGSRYGAILVDKQPWVFTFAPGLVERLMFEFSIFEGGSN